MPNFREKPMRRLPISHPAVALELLTIRMQDLDAVHMLHRLAETDRYNTMGIPESIVETQQLVSGWLTLIHATPSQKYVFRIQNDAADFIGLVGINPGKPGYRDAEIWYKLHPMHWNKGYATAVVRGILRFCFEELQLHRVQAGCVTENIGSVRVLEKCGFRKEGHCLKKLPIRGEWMDNYEFAILEEEYQRSDNPLKR